MDFFCESTRLIAKPCQTAPQFDSSRVALPGGGALRLALGYRRSTDFDPSDEPGQDHAQLLACGKYVVGVLADGVSQSYFGNIAAQCLVTGLADYLLERVAQPPSGAEMVERLDRLAGQAQEEVVKHPIPESVPHLVRSALERVRQQAGSQAVFAAFVLDTETHIAHVYQVGDAGVVLHGSPSLPGMPISANPAGRWGSKPSTLHLSVTRATGIFGVVLRSDGAREWGNVLGQAFGAEAFAARASVLADYDDVSFVSVQIEGRIPGAALEVLPLPVSEPPHAGRPEPGWTTASLVAGGSVFSSAEAWSSSEVDATVDGLAAVGAKGGAEADPDTQLPAMEAPDRPSEADSSSMSEADAPEAAGQPQPGPASGGDLPRSEFEEPPAGSAAGASEAEGSIKVTASVPESISGLTSDFERLPTPGATSLNATEHPALIVSGAEARFGPPASDQEDAESSGPGETSERTAEYDRHDDALALRDNARRRAAESGTPASVGAGWRVPPAVRTAALMTACLGVGFAGGATFARNSGSPTSVAHVPARDSAASSSTVHPPTPTPRVAATPPLSPSTVPVAAIPASAPPETSALLPGTPARASSGRAGGAGSGSGARRLSPTTARERAGASPSAPETGTGSLPATSGDTLAGSQGTVLTAPLLPESVKAAPAAAPAAPRDTASSANGPPEGPPAPAV